MRLDEPIAALRRVLLTIYVEDGSALADDAAVGLGASDVQVSINGAAFADADGTLTFVEAGLYYYEAALVEAGTEGFLGIKFDRAGYSLEFAWAPVGGHFALDETDAALLRVPLLIYDVSGALVEGATASGDDLQTSSNGDAFSDAAGELEPLGDGIYYYQGIAADAAVEGWLSIKYEKAGFGTQHAWVAVAAPGGDEDPPIITVISPTPGVPPGEPGGFSADPAVARVTPIVLEIVDDAIAYAAVFARFDGANARTPVFRRGAFEPGYSLFSSLEIVDAETMRLHVRADNGWRSTVIAFDCDAVDSGGNVT